MRVRKHFVTVGTRRVHYHRAGEGPPVILLHASACSAKVLRPLVETFAARFTAVALDTPGFGLSDKLAVAEPSVEDFADALAETMDALGIAQTAVYGRHTGASIAVEFAARHPSRCAMALTDGYPLLSRGYDEAKIRAYLQPIKPTWDGAHLVWLWFRYRDQHAFWPWNAQRLENRADADIPDLDFLHRGVVEFLEAGADYRLGYAAPFRHDALGAFRRLRVPVCFGTRPGDWLHRQAHLYPAGTWHEVMPRDAREAAARELELLSRHPAAAAPPPAPACTPLPGRATTDYVELDGANLLVRASGEARQRNAPLVVIHHAPGSSALYDELMLKIGRRRPCIALDLPGQGESDSAPGNPQNPEFWGRAALRALDALGLARVHLYGHGSGAAAAVEAALQGEGRVLSCALDAPIACGDPAFAARYAPDLAPSWEGAHLLRAWHFLRDQELWWPWFERSRAAIRANPPRIDPAALMLRVREILKQPASCAPALRAALTYPTPERLARLRAPVALICAPEDTFWPLFAAVRTLRADAWVRQVEDTPESRAAALEEFWKSKAPDPLSVAPPPSA